MKIYLLLPALLLLNSCIPGKTGSLRPSTEITQAFEECVVFPDYDYYYMGPEAQPDVILGVKHSYSFTKGLWKDAALDRKKLCDWIQMIAPELRFDRNRYEGYAVYSADGEEVGIWYARTWADWTTILKDRNRLTIYSPMSPTHKLEPFKPTRDD